MGSNPARYRVHESLGKGGNGLELGENGFRRRPSVAFLIAGRCNVNLPLEAGEHGLRSGMSVEVVEVGRIVGSVTAEVGNGQRRAHG